MCYNIANNKLFGGQNENQNIFIANPYNSIVNIFNFDILFKKGSTINHYANY